MIDNPACSVCSICTHRFEIARSGLGPLRFNGVGLRYGAGLYFSSASCKSNDYAGASQRSVNDVSGIGAAEGKTGVRLMFLCRVLKGNAYPCKELSLSPNTLNELVKPAGRFDSVYGLTSSTGGELTYDELVVYRNDAAVPSYLIVYQT